MIQETYSLVQRVQHPNPTEVRIYQLRNKLIDPQFPNYEKAVHADSLNRLVLFNEDASSLDMMFLEGQPILLSKNGDLQQRKFEIGDSFFLCAGEKPVVPYKLKIKFTEVHPLETYLRMAAEYIKSEQEKIKYEEARKHNTALPEKSYRAMHNFFRAKIMGKFFSDIKDKK